MSTIAARVATWTAIAAPTKYVVGGLNARSECVGKAIYLSWVNPSAATRVKIVRRLKAWPFDLTDAYDTVYDGAPITSFTDIGPLQPQTYYYYLVLVSKDAGPTYTYDIDDPSRIFALSIDVYAGKQWFIDNTARHNVELDGVPAEQGGGGGFLDKWFTVMGCWLNLMRGHLNALALTGDPDKAPFNVLTAKNQSLGIEPEGFAFDYDIVRRPLTSLVYVYKRKGTCPGIIETVRMFTKWDATCKEFAFNQCAGGASGLKMWDGVSKCEYGLEAGTPFVSQVTSPLGAARFQDTTKAWANDLYKGGTLRGWIGDIACVDTNVGNVTTILAPRTVTTLIAGSAAGSSTLSLASTAGLSVGMSIQLVNTTETLLGSGTYASEIVDISSITPGAPGSVGIRGTLASAYAAGSILTIGKSIIRREFTGTATVAGQVLTDTTAKWVDTQWKGYKLLDSANVLHNVTSSTGTTMTVDGGAPAAGTYSLAYGFTLGASFAARTPLARYKVSNGTHSTWLEPSYDLEVRGTSYDPYNRLWYGPGASLTGVYGPQDIAAYITTPVTVISGRASSVLGFIFNLDASQPAPAIDALKGYYLNPNQNQEQMFEILSNTATTVTVAGAVDSLVKAGQYYYVLKPRDKVRFQRLATRLRKEFTDTDVKAHVLFV